MSGDKTKIEVEEKSKIFYSRDYRHLNGGGVLYFIGLFLVLTPTVFIYLNLYEELSKKMAEFAQKYVSMFTGQKVAIYERSYFPKFGNIFCIGTSGKTPSFTLAFISFLITLVLIIICSNVKTNRKPVMIFVTIGLYIHACSSLYFMLIPEKFPYTVDTYSELYMKQQIVLWLMVLIVYIFSISLVKGMYMCKFITLFSLICVMGAYGFLRYVVYVTILIKASYLFMASLYFTFGVLFDFMLMVAIYAIFMRRASAMYRKISGGKLWKWS